MIIALLLALAAQDSVSSIDTLEFPDAMRPAFDGYMGCLQVGLNKRVQALPSIPVNFDTVATTVVAECKARRAVAFRDAQSALAPGPVPSPDNHAAVINSVFSGLEVSFAEFAQKVRAAVEAPAENAK